MGLNLRSDVFGVAIDGDLVLLDVRADRYICLPGALSEADSFQAENPTAWSSELSQRLANAGVLDGIGASVDRFTPSLAHRSVLNSSLPDRVGHRDCLDSLGAVHDVRGALRRPGLAPLLSMSSGWSSDRQSSEADVLKAAHLFSRILPWLPIDGACLVRSALLMRFLAKRRMKADWVFGVRLWPFEAHCWVQIGDVCLNDDAERLVGFTPIYRR